MRITMQTIHQNILGNLNRITTDLNDINQRISSGKQMSKLSDDPVNLAIALGLRSSVVEIEQYMENLSHGDSVIIASENALTQTKEQVMQASTLAIQAVNGILTMDDRLLMAEDSRHLFEQSLTLSNTQVSGKYIFGGFRTTGYTIAEPTPFMQDLVDGYRINGYTPADMTTGLNVTMVAGNIAAGDLAVNGNATGGAITTAGPTNGLFMDKAADVRTEIMAADPTVTVELTTLNESGATTADGGGGSQFFFYLNDVPLTVTISAGANQATVASETAAAINAISDQTGVTAVPGDGVNGGTDNTRLVLSNTRTGDESNIVVSGFTTVVAGGAALGFGNFTQGADATHNTGQIAISSAQSFELSSPNNPADDSILNLLGGLGGGAVGFADDPNDGILVYGSRLATGDLLANGLPVSGAVSDGISDILSDASAAAKAAAINGDFATTGVSAEVTPAYRMGTQAVEAGTEYTMLTGTVDNSVIAAGDLAINGFTLGVINTAAPQDGLNMTKAVNTKTEINLQATATGVSARLTTLFAGAAAGAGTITNVSFDLNGVAVSFTTSATPGADAVTAINAVSDQTGVSAVLGDGTNGGPAGAVVLRNTVNGDESNIVITAYNGGVGTATTGLGNINQTVDLTHNTGQITLSSFSSFTLTSPNNPADDLILAGLGLGGGQAGTGIPGDVAADGILAYGSTPQMLDSGDLVINGVDIFDLETEVAGSDATNSLLMAINGKQALTGVVASVSGSGVLMLSAVDGRNLHIETSALGERVTHLNGGSPPIPQDKVYFGSVILSSDRAFSLETTPTAVSGYEAGLAALGLDGGTVNSGEPGDVAGDGLISVTSIIRQDGNVRYTGDRQNDFEIRVGTKTTLEVGKNGEDAIADTGVFTTLKALDDALRGENYRQVVSPFQAADTSASLAGSTRGLRPDVPFQDGTFNITVTDHEYYPPRVFSMSIGVNTATDTFETIAQKINGVSNINASWDVDGFLQVETVDPGRYSFSLQDETTNFLENIGINSEEMQVQALEKSIADLAVLQDELSNQVSDFGARANRIEVQIDIFASLRVSTLTSLSDREDTDIVEALMELKAKEVAYEVALAAAAKTMQLSLVNFL